MPDVEQLNWLQYERRHNPTPPPVTLPEKYRDAVVRQIPDGPVRDTIVEYGARLPEFAAEGRAPLFLGRTQQWKTYGAAVLARAANLKYSIDTQWVSVPEAFPLWTLETFEQKRQMLDRWKRVAFLVLDDILFCETNSPEHKILETVLASRFENLRPTCMTGNLSSRDPFADLAGRFGPLLGRRIQETSQGFTVLIS